MVSADSLNCVDLIWSRSASGRRGTQPCGIGLFRAVSLVEVGVYLFHYYRQTQGWNFVCDLFENRLRKIERRSCRNREKGFVFCCLWNSVIRWLPHAVSLFSSMESCYPPSERHFLSCNFVHNYDNQGLYLFLVKTDINATRMIYIRGNVKLVTSCHHIQWLFKQIWSENWSVKINVYIYI